MHREAGDRGADRAAVGDRARRRPRCRHSRPSTPTPPSTSRSRPSTRPPSPPGSVRPVRFSSAPYSPVSLGDYCAGSNHVLPTAGCARHSSGLSVQTFLRGIHVVDYTEAALKDVSGYVITLAQAENLPAHGEAVRRRFETVSDPGTARHAGRPAAARGPARQIALRRTATGRSGAAQHQREPAPADAGTRRRRRGLGPRRRSGAAPLSRPRRGGAAHRPGRVPDGADRRRGRRRKPLGRQRFQRDPAAAAAGVRRSGPQRDRVRAVVFDAPDHRRRHPDRMAGGQPRRRLQPRRRCGRRRYQGAPPRRGVRRQPEQPVGTKRFARRPAPAARRDGHRHPDSSTRPTANSRRSPARSR